MELKGHSGTLGRRRPSMEPPPEMMQECFEEESILDMVSDPFGS